MARTTRTIGVAAALLIGLAPALLGTSNATAAALTPGVGLSTNYDFARLVLRDGGWPLSVANVTVLTQWLRAEEPTTHWWNRDNPLNNGLGSGGGDGTGSYGSLVTAAYDVALNLQNPAYGYPMISRDLETSAPAIVTAMAIWRSSWAAGHYGRGVDWGTSPVESIPSPPSAWKSPVACPVAYPASDVGPCGRWFTTTGATWHTGAPQGERGQELWAYASRGVQDTATWAPQLASGAYEVSAFLPALFDDANAQYVVVDAGGAHRRGIDQEPYVDAWAPLGLFHASTRSSIKVTLSTASSGQSGATYVAADAMRFERVDSSGGLARGPAPLRRTSIRPGPPLNVAAVAGDASATVTWLAPSKEGATPVRGFSAVARPSGRTCSVPVRTPSENACTITGLRNGTAYTFVVRAYNHTGFGRTSAASSPARPLGSTGLRVLAIAPSIRFGARVVYRATITPGRSGGTVLFAEDGVVLPGCEHAKVVNGKASCALIATSARQHVILATFTGNRVLAGAEGSLAVLIERAPTSFHVFTTPTSLLEGATLTMWAWHLPGHATGRVVFDSGLVRLCVAAVRGGGASCATAVHLAPGPHVVRARYVGDRDYLGSLATTSFRVLVSQPPPTSAPRP